ncbi:class A sortase [Aerococcus kribbianus]|uniref:Class A sortase n=1 Tax=Aerococcus kribbianus TaxID=2999064 RepID=A0A9X3FW66_9LACT|nr:MULTISPECIES: class A sortase [unclassified Aerococcus]MCZ0717344.1 class A sortase [Aerococcus sp. YH-aer221]MCZ0725632.1 class A sortase [Aerococcus sp. YH-aer222]
MARKRKFSLRKLLGALLILVGIVIIAINFLPNPQIARSVNESQEAVDQVTAEEIKENKTSDDAVFDFDAVENINPTSAYIDSVEMDPSLIIGQMVIPQSEINMTLFKGVSEPVLYAGVGTMRPDQVMGQGNYPIAGHYDWNGHLLYRLDWVKSGDVIRITDKDKIYEYVAVANDVVEPNAAYLITDDYAQEEYGQPIISIMNCFFPQRYYNGDDDRYFVFGVLVNETNYAPEKMNVKDFNWDSEEEKAEFETNNPSKDGNYSFDQYKDNQWAERNELEAQE